MHHYACKIDALMKEARRVTQEFKDFHKGAITIGASYVPATYLLPEIVHQFQCEFPNIKITLMVKQLLKFERCYKIMKLISV